MRKFAKILNSFNSLKQQGLEQLDINIDLMTQKSQDLVNKWCQEFIDEIVEQITVKGYYQPPIEYQFYSCEVKDWALKHAAKVQEQWEEWHSDCIYSDLQGDYCEVDEPFEYSLQPEDYFQLQTDGLYAHVSADYGPFISYIGVDLLDLYDFLNEDESYEELHHLYFGKSELTEAERIYLLDFS